MGRHKKIESEISENGSAEVLEIEAPTIDDRCVYIGATKQIYMLSDIGHSTFETFMKSPTAMELELDKGQPIIKITNKEDFINHKIKELELREKKIEEREAQNK